MIAVYSLSSKAGTNARTWRQCSRGSKKTLTGTSLSGGCNETALLVLAGSTWLASPLASYTYDRSGMLNPYQSSDWTINGTASASNNMYTSADAAGGSLIFTGSLPNDTYEVRTTLTLTNSGGHYITYL